MSIALLIASAILLSGCSMASPLALLKPRLMACSKAAWGEVQGVTTLSFEYSTIAQLCSVVSMAYLVQSPSNLSKVPKILRLARGTFFTMNCTVVNGMSLINSLSIQPGPRGSKSKKEKEMPDVYIPEGGTP